MNSKSIFPKNKEVIEQFEAKHLQAAFLFKCNPQRCENPSYYEDYLKYNALVDGKNGMGNTFVFCEYEKDKVKIIKGFITLKASSVITTNDSGTIEGCPAMEIAELAVAADYEGEGIGSHLLFYALSVAKRIAKQDMGIRYIATCAAPSAVGFYEKVLDMAKARESFDIPRERWNTDCIPLLLRIGEY